MLPPTLTPSDMLVELGSAEHVLSAGMHGIIVAHALRTPATLVSLRATSSSVPSFKYHDYHRSVGLDAVLTPWQAVADAAGQRDSRARAERDLLTCDDRIDELVDGLFRSAAPLRSAG
ncbi:hypothetical protein P9139_00215 [Curtobacterium flaccumfaciens]|nr:hypothetical protein P9139_00215 [Curtobacterium flaccumfaciens]